jgi:chemotaxis protein MotA
VFDKERDSGTFIGFILAFGLIVLCISVGSGATVFLDLPSLLIVLGGTFGAALVTYPLEDVLKLPELVKSALFYDPAHGQIRLKRLLEVAERFRTEGPPALQQEQAREGDLFFRKSLGLVADAIPSDDIRRILELEISFQIDRHRKGAQLLNTMGILSPAMGLIGTIIGLVQMLKNLDDPSAIGPAMAVALITTFYGSVFANIVFLPLAGKLRARSEQEVLIKEMTTEGMVNVAKGMNPRILEECLHGFLAPDSRFTRY